ncbi:MAG TPA: alkaline phosphatase PhoX [Gemmatimonadaceae bacterium]|nr:alkaline phosphatase PhoX [Gemmatimonadaceae bacterium]
MRVLQHATRLTLAGAATLCFTACQDNPPTAPSPLLSASALSGRSAENFRGPFQFTPLASSFTCTVSGGDPVHPLALAEGLDQSIIASEPQFADAIDMNTQNETGKDRGRYLYRPSEGSISEVSVTDLKNLGPNSTKRFAFRADWESFDPIVWTPWGTILVGEEANVASKPDPDVPQAKGGLVYELFPSKDDPSVLDHIAVRPAIGSKAHEGMRFDVNGNLYSISERNPGYIYKFVPDDKGDLSSGQLYVLKITNATGDRTGDAVWIPLDRQAVQVDAAAAADAVGATGYNRPEDVEIGTSSGNFAGNVLFVAVTGRANPADNRVIAIDLGEGSNSDQAFVYNYVAPGVNVPAAEFDMPDNLALDRAGNLFIAEDPGGSFPGKTKGDDIWMATPGLGRHAAATQVVRAASLTDCDAEPTGLYWDVNGNQLFANVQHRGGDKLDKAVAIFRE